MLILVNHYNEILNLLGYRVIRTGFYNKVVCLLGYGVILVGVRNLESVERILSSRQWLKRKSALRSLNFDYYMRVGDLFGFQMC